MNKQVDKTSRELRYKDRFMYAFNGGATHWGNELSLGMLAEIASEITSDLVAATQKHAAIDELEALKEAWVKTPNHVGSVSPVLGYYQKKYINERISELQNDDHTPGKRLEQLRKG